MGMKIIFWDLMHRIGCAGLDARDRMRWIGCAGSDARDRMHGIGCAGSDARDLNGVQTRLIASLRS